MIRKLYDAMSNRWYRFRVRRVLRRRGDADEWPLFVGIAYLILSTVLGVAVPACAHRQHMREIESVRARCLRAAESTPSEHLEAAEDECMRRLEELR